MGERALGFALIVALGCNGSGTIPDDDDTAGVPDDDDDSSANGEDCVDPPADELAQLHADVDDYLRADDPGEAPALLAALDDQYAGVCFEHFVSAIHTWSGDPPASGVNEETYFIEHWEETGEVFVYVPEGLPDDQRVPLLVWLHGAGADTGATWAYDPFFQEVADGQGVILASPTCDEICDWSVTESCGSQVISLVRHLKRRYPVDDDRVYLTGHSMGGRGSFTMGLTYASTYAGLIPSAATIGATSATLDVEYHADYCRPHVENALNQRVDLVTGMADNEYLVAQNEGAALAFDELGYDFAWTALEDQPHAFAAFDWSEAVDWVMQRQRDPYPAHAIWNLAEHNSSYFEHLYLHTIVNPAEYWLRIDDRGDSEVPARVEGIVDGQAVVVTTDNVTELTVLLADELLDLDQPLTIEVNGETWFDGSVERSPHLALTSARERSERSMVFAVQVSGDVDVPTD